ncbi:dihydrofolate reductase family protein [Chryseobacterium paridis]|uniref:Dihydrofolate reductase family protein n=1 Tax=Chryseobacterium paridis TaxID=2800328 RepID=A0ABS1FU73_9FLAO|nr:dihydrofolate reductase family protein [Chryseobacterium paridis]MBK1895788.1 dihydrofolate reductase family protein [Chryseobacterium paridis]
MRKLKLQMQMTIDGFVSGPNGEQDWVWLSPPDEVGFQKIVELAETSDTLLLGRKMTRQFIDHWENVADNLPDNPTNTLAKLIVDMRKITFSHTETSIAGRNLEVENRDLTTIVEGLKKESGKDILAYGGADFVSSLIDQDLIDEYYIIVNPVAIGKGLPIFNGRKVLKLESSTPFKSGKVLNKYLPVRES